MGSEPNTSGFLSEQNLAAFENRAKGGAAIVTRGETLVHAHTGSAHGNLCNLDKCGDGLFNFACLPLKLRDCDGSPARAVAWVE